MLKKVLPTKMKKQIFDKKSYRKNCASFPSPENLSQKIF